MVQICTAATGPPGRYSWSIIPPPLTHAAVLTGGCRKKRELYADSITMLRIVVSPRESMVPQSETRQPIDGQHAFG